MQKWYNTCMYVVCFVFLYMQVWYFICHQYLTMHTAAALAQEKFPHGYNKVYFIVFNKLKQRQSFILALDTHLKAFFSQNKNYGCWAPSSLQRRTQRYSE